MSSTMDCPQVERRLDEYAASELNPEERAEVDQHLHRCAHCRAALRDLHALDARIRALPVRTLPDDFVAQVHAKLRKDPPGLDQRSTAPSAWLSDDAATVDTSHAFLHFTRFAA